ncbi:malectin-B [Trichostrongylus colubriformis]|uniref:Malectin-B n=1 Tax=Trichostrongylus colubriformis TaxID=6319 RepID=A0AAN8II65_TRICO
MFPLLRIGLLFVNGFSSISGKPPDLSKRVVHAVNCGGNRHVGAYGIVYQEDRNPIGVVSDYGARYLFPNAPTEDRKLYETERYYQGDLSYVFDIAKDGEYVIVLKFSEVYFQSPGQKVFHVHVNDLPVKRDLDIFRESHATGVAYDLYIDVSIKKNEITIGDLIGDIDHELHIRLLPELDNPKINAIAVLTGTSATLPSPPAPVEPQESSHRRSRQEVIDDEEEEEDYDELEPISTHMNHQRGDDVTPEPGVASGPRTPDPYADKNDNVFVYLGVTLVCLLPVVAFLMHM